MIVIKVLFRKGRFLYSSNAGMNRSKYKQRYFKSKENFPRFFLPILCFEDLQCARNFLFRNSTILDEDNYEIWECEGKPDEGFRKIIFDPCSYDTPHPEDMTLEIFNKRWIGKAITTRTVPDGTVGMKSIKLLRKLQ